LTLRRPNEPEKEAREQTFWKRGALRSKPPKQGPKKGKREEALKLEVTEGGGSYKKVLKATRGQGVKRENQHWRGKVWGEKAILTSRKLLTDDFYVPYSPRIYIRPAEESMESKGDGT